MTGGLGEPKIIMLYSCKLLPPGGGPANGGGSPGDFLKNSLKVFEWATSSSVMRRIGIVPTGHSIWLPKGSESPSSRGDGGFAWPALARGSDGRGVAIDCRSERRTDGCCSMGIQSKYCASSRKLWSTSTPSYNLSTWLRISWKAASLTTAIPGRPRNPRELALATVATKSLKPTKDAGSGCASADDDQATMVPSKTTESTRNSFMTGRPFLATRLLKNSQAGISHTDLAPPPS